MDGDDSDPHLSQRFSGMMSGGEGRLRKTRNSLVLHQADATSPNFPRGIPSSTSSVTSGSSTYSISSTYRHHHVSHVPKPPTTPKPVLPKDTNHEPKTRGSVGIMIAGLGGNNSVTMLAGVVANRMNIKWRGPRGELMAPNYNGCITQCGKFKEESLANVSMAAVGGWDTRPTKLGDALLDARILDYDLVRQIHDEMNKIKVFRGYCDPRFTADPDKATHILSGREASTVGEALKCLRADIRYFKWRNGVVGHTTIIYSQEDETEIELVKEWETARDLLDALESSEEKRGGPFPPSLLYATAALLEGCSFVNGTLNSALECPGLMDLARQQVGVYCVGTAFQTSPKLPTIEYLKSVGLVPKIVTSSDYAGNPAHLNRMRSQNIPNELGSWEQEMDHQSGAMYTPFLADEKREYVEYTSLGFLGQHHTMVTYTQVVDSVMCAPLMIDAAVWCDYFSNRSWSAEKVSSALAYMFCGSERGGPNGFHEKMKELQSQVHGVTIVRASQRTNDRSSSKKRVRIRPEEKASEWAIPHDASIICAGLGCVDMQLNQATGGDGGESIETFEGEKSIGGGSVSMACKTLARLCHGAPLDEGFMQVAPPVVHSVVPLCKIGNDDTGNKLLALLEGCGEATRNVETKYAKLARKRDPGARTALAVLPIYKDGRRGCFFDAASNATFSPREMVDMLNSLAAGSNGPTLDTSQLTFDDLAEYQDRVEDATPKYGAFLFGYPHLLPMLQGGALAGVMREARKVMIEGGIIALDLNGVPEGTFDQNGSLRTASDLKSDPVIGAALEHVDILHMNEDELVLLTGCRIVNSENSKVDDEFEISRAVNLFLKAGVAIVVVTRGKKGSFVSCNSEKRFSKSPMLPSSWVDCTAKLGASELPSNTVINTNGAGDSFTSGFLVASMLRHTGMTVPISAEDEDDRDPQSSEASLDLGELELSPPKSRNSLSPIKRLTPYQLYMSENYVSLKQQCKDDKKAVFTKCHEMWEQESDDVKAMYERRAKEEGEAFEMSENELSMRLVDAMEALDSTAKTRSGSEFGDDDMHKNVYMTNRALNLESAIQFSGLVAMHHIDMSTRDLSHIDLSRLLERAQIFPEGLEEI